MVVTVWVMLELRGDKPAAGEDPIVVRGDSAAAVIFVNRCGGSKDKRAFLLMRMLRCLQIKGGLSHVATHIPGVQKTLADGVSRWPCSELVEKVRSVTSSDEWVEQHIGPRGLKIFGLVLYAKNVVPRHGHYLWNIMVDDRGPA